VEHKVQWFLFYHAKRRRRRKGLKEEHFLHICHQKNAQGFISFPRSVKGIEFKFLATEEEFDDVFGEDEASVYAGIIFNNSVNRNVRDTILINRLDFPTKFDALAARLQDSSDVSKHFPGFANGGCKDWS
jgi:hypothetical protein